MKVKIVLLGFGNVGKAFAKLLQEKHDLLSSKYALDLVVSGIATGSHGIAFDPVGIDLSLAEKMLEEAGDISPLSKLKDLNTVEKFIDAVKGDVLIEISPVNYQNGEPALSYIRQSLEQGMHVVTANKGPVVFSQQELERLAQKKGKKFLFESTVMDGAPVFSMIREGLPGANIQSISGILNSTTNLILDRMQSGESFKDAISFAQSIGIAESDPSGDVEGWDAAIKLCILVNLMMGASLRPQDIERTGIENITPDMIQKAQDQNKRWKLLCQASKLGNKIKAEVSPQLISQESPFYYVDGTSSVVQINSDVLGELTLVEKDPGPHTTAYGLLADVINALK